MAAALLAHGADPNGISTVKPGYATNRVEKGRVMFGAPLHFAAARDDAILAGLLLSNGADVEVRSIYGETPLTVAVIRGSAEVVGLLLGAGADLNTKDKSGRTMLSCAVESGHLEVVQALLAGKADPNGIGSNRLPAILHARGHPDMLQTLLEAGADPNVDDGQGRTPLFSATADGQVDSVRVLAEHGARVEVQPFGLTPLTIAAKQGDQRMAEVLLENGANVSSRTSGDGYSPLHQAALRKDTAITALLLSHGADVNARDNQGRTPLHLATLKEDKAVTALLLSHDADVNALDDQGNTPLDYAKRNGAQNLLQHGSAYRSSLPPQIHPPRTLPTRTVKTVEASASSTSPGGRTETALTALLREHGALDELPDWNSIRVTRQGLEQPIPIFRADTNGWNRFTLLEFLPRVYSKDAVYRNGIATARRAVFEFPDLARLIVHRPSKTPGGKGEEIEVNLLSSTNGIDCTKDIWLEFGDVVEIPEREHSLNERGVGLTKAQTADINACIGERVTLVVRGQSKEIVVPAARAHLRGILNSTEARSILLTSSDLSRVKVTRKSQETGQTTEFIVSEEGDFVESEDLWLRNGDVIEVPEKP